MYFDGAEMFIIGEHINSNYRVLAHTATVDKSEKRREETLTEHTGLCEKYFLSIIESKKLQDIFDNVYARLFTGMNGEANVLFKEMIYNTVLFHDLGKTNPNFQNTVMGNNLKIKNLGYSDKGHSLLSAMYYMNYYFYKIANCQGNARMQLLDMMYLNAYCISRHHGGLNDFYEFMGRIAAENESIFKNKDFLLKTVRNLQLNVDGEKLARIRGDYYKKISHNEEKNVARAGYVRILLSLLFAADFYATSEFMDGAVTEDFGNFDEFERLQKIYHENAIQKNIRNYECKYYQKGHRKSGNTSIGDINVLRNELFLDSERAFIHAPEKNIYYLEAPTGGGKSNIALNLSFQMMGADQNKHKIIYVYPFNTLVEQNIAVLKKSFSSEGFEKNIAVINSLTSIKVESQQGANSGEQGVTEEYANPADYEREHQKYKRALLNRQFLNYPMVLMTHVTLFKYLFSTHKEDVFPMHQMANSIIVMDEIQCYKNSIWSEIIRFLSVYADIFNMKIIIMSATLPDLDLLIDDSGIRRSTRLILEREKYFCNPLFKNRVQLDFSLLSKRDDEAETIGLLAEKAESYANEGKKVLLEFITKKRAEAFFEFLRERDLVNCEVELLTGDYNSVARMEILDKTKTGKPIILVATQVVEAGVDIDMDVGFKNISLFDSEEQFLGRLNRSARKEGCKAYFFCLDEPTAIYRGDVRKQMSLTLKNSEIQNLLLEKDTIRYYGKVLAELKRQTTAQNDCNVKAFFTGMDERNGGDVGLLNHRKIEERMKLINDDQYKITVFFNDRFTLPDGHVLRGDEVWTEYKKLLVSKALSYAENRVKMSEVKAKMGLFTYELRCEDLPPYEDRVGDLYYIEEGDKYLENGRLSRRKLKEDLFL